MIRFWKINYVVSVYLLLVLLFYISVGTSFYANNKWFQAIQSLLTVNETLMLFTFFAEWIQIPLCLIVLFFFKEERTKTHFFYIGIMVLLNLAKLIFWFLAVSSVTHKT